MDEERGEGDPGERGDQARGRPRVLRRPGHTDEQGREDLARRRRGEGHRQALHRRLRRPEIYQQSRLLRVGGTTISQGETITIDGSTGQRLPRHRPAPPARAQGRGLRAADLGRRDQEARGLGERGHPRDAAARARKMGAEGIGLARTESMFNAEERLPLVVSMIMASTRGGEEVLPREAQASAEAGLQEDPEGDARPSGHHQAPRPSSPRVPPQASRTCSSR